jgi:hypothetical protein
MNGSQAADNWIDGEATRGHRSTHRAPRRDSAFSETQEENRRLAG